MAGKTKPKCRRIVRPLKDPFSVAMSYGTLFTEDERNTMLKPLREALDAMRQGVATEYAYWLLVTAVQVSMFVEQRGVIRGLSDQFILADQVLSTIHARALTPGGWVSPTLYASEISALVDLVRYHTFHLENLTCGEFQLAVKQAIARQRQGGGKVVKHSEIQDTSISAH